MATGLVGDRRGDEAARSSPHRPTIRDVAKRAAVSKSLVSLVYSAPESVSAVRRDRVFAAAAELGFRPNRIARSLNGVRDDIVGILVADPRNPVLDDVVEAARAELEHAGLLGLMTSAVRPETAAPELDTDVLSMIADLNPSRLLIVGSMPGMNRIAETMIGTRLVVASAVADGIDVVSVRGDDNEGICLIVAHLRTLGHRRIAYLGGGGIPVAARRARSFVEAATANGLDGTRVIPADFTERSGYRAAQAALDRDAAPTALVAGNDLAAIGALTAVRERGLSDRVAVTGYDNTYLAALGVIDLTSVEPGNALIGHRAAELLCGEVAPQRDVLIVPHLVVRGSTRTVTPIA